MTGRAIVIFAIARRAYFQVAFVQHASVYTLASFATAFSATLEKAQPASLIY
jgi:hypothetical protein